MQQEKPYIIFDFGNVLLDIDYSLTKEALSQLCGQDWSDGIPEHVLQWMRDLEKGNMRSETFLWHFQFYFNSNLNPRAIIKAWNALLIGIPKTRISFLKHINSQYKTALFSNTNQIHLDWVYTHLKKDHNLQASEFEDSSFNFVFYSHLIGHRKPEKQIYQFIEDQLDIKSKDILFIDDLEDNVQAARDHGWFAIQHDPEKNIEQVIEKYIKLWHKK